MGGRRRNYVFQFKLLNELGNYYGELLAGSYTSFPAILNFQRWDMYPSGYPRQRCHYYSYRVGFWRGRPQIRT